MTWELSQIYFWVLFGAAMLCLVGYFYSVYRIWRLERELKRNQELSDWLRRVR